jgi:hypothetical protein
VFTRKFDEKVVTPEEAIESGCYILKDSYLVKDKLKSKILASKTMFITEYNKIELFQYKNMKKDVEDIITWYFDVLTSLTDDFIRIAIENNIKIKGLIE